jgi:predicted SAM-dependent methyltransferase
MGKINLIGHWMWSKSLRDVNDYFKDRSKNKQALRMREQIISNYLKNNENPKLQIGCGFNVIPGWLNTDLAYSDKVAFLDACKPYPFASETFNYVFTEHLFEHLTLPQEMAMLNECYRVMKKGGKLRLATPDFDFLIKLYNGKGKTETDYVKWSTQRYVYDVRDLMKENEFHEVFVINNFFRDWGHQVIHNFATLEIVLKKAGFREVTRQKVGESSDPVLNKLERHGNIIPPEFNELETIVVEAIK